MTEEEQDRWHDEVVARYPGGLTPAQFRKVVLESADDDGRVYPPSLDESPPPRLLQAMCFDCSLPYADDGFQDLIIDDSAWRKISPDGEGNGLLCPNCINRRLARHGIETTGQFRSGPLVRPATG